MEQLKQKQTNQKATIEVEHVLTLIPAPKEEDLCLRSAWSMWELPDQSEMYG